MEDLIEIKQTLHGEQLAHNQTYTKLVTAEKEMISLSKIISSLEEYEGQTFALNSELSNTKVLPLILYVSWFNRAAISQHLHTHCDAMG
jgi:hypothetical protein